MEIGKKMHFELTPINEDQLPNIEPWKWTRTSYNTWQLELSNIGMVTVWPDGTFYIKGQVSDPDVVIAVLQANGLIPVCKLPEKISNIKVRTPYDSTS